MAEVNGKNGNPASTDTGSTAGNGSGNGKGKLTSLLEESKVVREKALEEIKALKQPEKTDLWKSVLRVKHDETPRSRALPNRRHHP